MFSMISQANFASLIVASATARMTAKEWRRLPLVESVSLVTAKCRSPGVVRRIHGHQRDLRQTSGARRAAIGVPRFSGPATGR